MRKSKAWVAPLLAVAAWSGSLHVADARDGLSFAEALAIADAEAPSLAAETQGVAMAQALVSPAGALPDPRLVVGLDNYPVSGPPAFGFDEEPMATGRIGLAQEFPNAAKRRARTAAAQAGVAGAEAERAIERLRVRRATARAWLARHFLEQQLVFIDALDAENRLLGAAVNARIAAGEAAAADAVLPPQEAARLADRRDALALEIAQANAGLARWVGEAAARPLAGHPPDFAVDHTHLRHRLEDHPDLALYAALIDAAEAGMREAIADKRPDYGIELAYGRRDPRFGDMVSVELSVDLPLFAKSRQDPVILARQAEVNRVAALREALLREHAADLERQIALHERAERALARQRETVVPLAREKAALVMAAYRAGTTGLDAVLAARRELIEARSRVIELEAEALQGAAALFFSYGARD